MSVCPSTRLWQIIPKKIIYYSILLFSDIEPITPSKVAHYSQMILNSEHIILLCSSKLHASIKMMQNFLSRPVSVIRAELCMYTCTHAA